MNLTKESFFTLIYQISGFICATVAGMMIARILGPSNRGIITIALLYPSFFYTIFNLSVGLGIVHHMGKKERDAKVFIGSAILIFIVLTIISLSVFFISLIVFKESFYKGVEIKYLFAAGISIPFYLMLYYFSSILQGRMDIKGYNISNQLSSFLNLFFIVLFIALWGLTNLGAIIAGISGVIIGGIFSLLNSIHKAGGATFDIELTFNVIKDGVKIHIGSIATFLFNQSNFFILNYYTTPSEVGFYSVAFTLSNVLFFFSVSLETGLYPKMAHATMEEAIKLVEVATRNILYMTALAAVTMAVFSKAIIMIYGGSAFLPSVAPLLILLPGVVFFTIPKILSTLWVRKGWFIQLTVMASVTAIISFVLNLLLIPRYGAHGAAIATTTTYSFSALIGLFLYWKYVNRGIPHLFIPNRGDLAIYKDIIGVFTR